MVADWRSPLADCFRANQIRPISLAVFIKIFFRCSLTEKRSLLISMERTMFIAPGWRSPAAFQIPTIPGWFWLTADTTKSWSDFRSREPWNRPLQRSREPHEGFERDNYHVRYCVQRLTRFTATLDHVRPVAEDGDSSLENLVAACLDGLASRWLGGMLLITWLAHRLA